MLSFKESVQLEDLTDEELNAMVEAMSLQQRMAASRAFKRIKHKVKIGRERAKRKTANAETLQKRARKAARAQLMKKLSKNVSKDEMSFAQKQAMEKRLDKMKPKIEKLAKRMLPAIRKKERERKAAQQQSH